MVSAKLWYCWYTKAKKVEKRCTSGSTAKSFSKARPFCGNKKVWRKSHFKRYFLKVLCFTRWSLRSVYNTLIPPPLSLCHSHCLCLSLFLSLTHTHTVSIYLSLCLQILKNILFYNFLRFVPREKMTQRCEPSIRENCTMVMKTECNEVCREECEDKDKKVCMTIPHQVRTSGRSSFLLQSEFVDFQ